VGRSWKQHQRRFRYRKMTAIEFSAALDHLEMKVDAFAYISGAREDRVERWKRGEEDIPHSALALCVACTVPGVLALLMKTADHYAEWEPDS